MLEILMSLGIKVSPPSDVHVGQQGNTYSNPTFTYIPVNLAMCAHGTNLYLCGGTQAQGAAIRITAKFNTLTNTWTRLADIPTSVTNAFYHCMEVIGDKAYVISNETTLGILDLTTDTWSTRPLVSPYGSKFGSGWTVSGDEIFQVGGGSNSKDVLSYNPIQNVWRKYSDLPNGRSYGSVTCVDKKLYAFASPVTDAEDVLYELDIELDDGWKATSIKQPTFNFTRLLNFKGHLFSAGGWSGNIVNPMVREIIPQSGEIGINGQTTNPRVFGAYVMMATGSIWYYGGNVSTTSGAVQGSMTEYKTGMT